MMEQAEFDTNIGRLRGLVFRRNKLTVVVQLESGKLIKRHIRKHKVDVI